MGYYCLPVQPHNASLNAQPCPEGYYCPQGTGLDWRACPIGTFNDEEGIYEEIQCKACPGGKYCGYQHLTNYTGVCDAGKSYYVYQ